MSTIICQDPFTKSRLVTNEIIRVTNEVTPCIMIDRPQDGLSNKGIKVTTLNYVIYALQIIAKLETGKYLFEDEDFIRGDYGPYLKSIWDEFGERIPALITKPYQRFGIMINDNDEVERFDPFEDETLDDVEISLIEQYVPKLVRFSYWYLLDKFVEVDPQSVQTRKLNLQFNGSYNLDASTNYWKHHQFWNQI